MDGIDRPQPSAQLRSLAFAVAYRMLGSVAEAEDVVQEALLRLHGASGVENPEAFLTTVTTRLAIDVLRSARMRRETYVGAWLPEPLVGGEPDPAVRVEADETISLAFLTLLERLGPEERAVLVLREAFDWEFAEIAAALGKSEPACRQLLSRARRRIDAERPRFEAEPEQREALAARFLAAARGGDVEGLLALLAPDAVLTGDGGGKARALPAPLVGAASVARALAAFARMGAEWGIVLEPVTVNGQPGVRARTGDGAVVSILGIDVEGGRVVRLHSIVNPDKLAHLGAVSEIALRPSARRDRDRDAPPT
ncbi:RNA polymerase sigma-70 factor [Conexibacter sp. CPCC 206217]|uniref:RNA polymerase sigma-70 factor n=1 Tax=Conexibacter sp. CPCC 206217 TaxID=3064574 RepID=UPI00271D8E54|nr:RNA polymerase sigma-70 factor [Conexibacter sp. CPCC 206217]MDO8212974.1 RNA polymerase sigma-70 factor [Conexibacter sp. CPCC 206217]